MSRAASYTLLYNCLDFPRGGTCHHGDRRGRGPAAALQGLLWGYLGQDAAEGESLPTPPCWDPSSSGEDSISRHRPCRPFLTRTPRDWGGPCCAALPPSWVAPRSGWGPALRPQVLMPVSPAGCEEERGAALCCAVAWLCPGRKSCVCGSWEVEQLMNSGQAASLTAAHSAPALRPARSCIQPGQGCVVTRKRLQPGLRLPKSLLCRLPTRSPDPLNLTSLLPRVRLCPDHPLTVAARGHGVMTNSRELVSGVCVLSGGHLGAQGLDTRLLEPNFSHVHFPCSQTSSSSCHSQHGHRFFRVFLQPQPSPSPTVSCPRPNLRLSPTLLDIVFSLSSPCAPSSAEEALFCSSTIKSFEAQPSDPSFLPLSPGVGGCFYPISPVR